MLKHIISRLREFRQEEVDVNSENPNQIYPVPSANIQKAESNLGVHLPDDLKNLWLEAGYGFIRCSFDGTVVRDSNNFLMPHGAVVDAIRGGGIYHNADVVPGLIPFFDVGDGFLFALREREAGSYDVVVAYDARPVSESLADFLSELLKEPEFYLPPASRSHP